jgi:hypothetical protein
VTSGLRLVAKDRALVARRRKQNRPRIHSRADLVCPLKGRPGSPSSAQTQQIPKDSAGSKFQMIRLEHISQIFPIGQWDGVLVISL